jgi:hypothetical protein
LLDISFLLGDMAVVRAVMAGKAPGDVLTRGAGGWAVLGEPHAARSDTASGQVLFSRWCRDFDYVVDEAAPLGSPVATPIAGAGFGEPEALLDLVLWAGSGLELGADLDR